MLSLKAQIGLRLRICSGISEDLGRWACGPLGVVARRFGFRVLEGLGFSVSLRFRGSGVYFGLAFCWERRCRAGGMGPTEVPMEE